MQLIVFSLLSILNIIAPKSVDNIKIGMPIDTFIELASEKRIVKKETKNLEGDNYPIYNVYEDDKIAFAVESDSETETKVWRIWIYGNMFKTEAGIGIDDCLGDIKEKYTIKTYDIAEGQVLILVEETEISFFLDSKDISTNWWSNPTLDGLNDSTKINLIILW